jgi:hypothetical protein
MGCDKVEAEVSDRKVVAHIPFVMVEVESAQRLEPLESIQPTPPQMERLMKVVGESHHHPNVHNGLSKSADSEESKRQ